MEKKTNSKVQIFVAIITGVFVIIAAIISSPHWFKYFFPNQFVEEEIIQPQILKKDFFNTEIPSDSSRNEIKNSGTENIVISKIELCPISSKLPAYFLLEFKNEGTKTLKDLTFIIDLGKAEYKQLEFLGPNNSTFIIDSTKKNIIYVKIPVVRENETYILYTLLSIPVFKSILINGSNLVFAKEYSYEDYLTSEVDKTSIIDGFLIFLIIIVSIILIVLTFYFLRIVYTHLARKLGWDRYFKE